MRYLIVVIFIMSTAAISAQINGGTLMNNKVYCVIKNRISMYDILTGKQINSELIQENGIVKRDLFNAVIKRQRLLNNDTAIFRAELSKSLILNISNRNNRLYVCMRFKVTRDKISNVNFALLELDTNLNFTDYFLFRNPGNGNTIAFPPYHEFNFTTDSTLQLPRMAIFNEKITDQVYEVYLNRKSHSLQERQAVLDLKSEFVKYRNYNATERILFYPMFYPVSKSAYNIYHCFPLPFVYNSSDSSYFDPLKYKSRTEMFQMTNNTGFYDLAAPILFPELHKIYPDLIMSTYSNNNDAFIIISSQKEDKNTFSLYKYSRLTGTYKVFPLDYGLDSKYNYFIMEGNKLYILWSKGEELIVSVKELPGE